jgi:hypothetical protein
LYEVHSSPPSAVGGGGRVSGEGRRGLTVGQESPALRVAPSPDVQGSYGILRRRRRPRIDKLERGHRLRGSRSDPSGRRRGMRFAGIGIGAERHVVAVVDAAGTVLVKPTSVREDGGGYAHLQRVLGPPGEVLAVMEATGHYWQNLFAVLAAAGYAVALRTRRFAGEDLRRAKTDAIDALGLARFAAQRRPAATRLPDPVTRELRELVRFRDRLVQDFGDRVRQLHRLVDLGFPELTRHVSDLGSEVAVALLQAYPTARALAATRVGRVGQAQDRRAPPRRGAARRDAGDRGPDVRGAASRRSVPTPGPLHLRGPHGPAAPDSGSRGAHRRDARSA